MLIESKLFDKFVIIQMNSDYSGFCESQLVNKFVTNYLDNDLKLGKINSSSSDSQIEYYNVVFNEVMYHLHEACRNADKQERVIYIDDM